MSTDGVNPDVLRLNQFKSSLDSEQQHVGQIQLTEEELSKCQDAVLPYFKAIRETLADHKPVMMGGVKLPTKESFDRTFTGNEAITGNIKFPGLSIYSADSMKTRVARKQIYERLKEAKKNGEISENITPLIQPILISEGKDQNLKIPSERRLSLINTHSTEIEQLETHIAHAELTGKDCTEEKEDLEILKQSVKSMYDKCSKTVTLPEQLHADIKGICEEAKNAGNSFRNLCKFVHGNRSYFQQHQKGKTSQNYRKAQLEYIKGPFNDELNKLKEGAKSSGKLDAAVLDGFILNKTTQITSNPAAIRRDRDGKQYNEGVRAVQAFQRVLKRLTGSDELSGATLLKAGPKGLKALGEICYWNSIDYKMPENPDFDSADRFKQFHNRV